MSWGPTAFQNRQVLFDRFVIADEGIEFRFGFDGAKLQAVVGT